MVSFGINYVKRKAVSEMPATNTWNSVTNANQTASPAIHQLNPIIKIIWYFTQVPYWRKPQKTMNILMYLHQSDSRYVLAQTQ